MIGDPMSLPALLAVRRRQRALDRALASAPTSASRHELDVLLLKRQ
jgi:hypothetical protein